MHSHKPCSGSATSKRGRAQCVTGARRWSKISTASLRHSATDITASKTRQDTQDTIKKRKTRGHTNHAAGFGNGSAASQRQRSGKNGRRLQACRNGDKHRPDRDRHLSRQPQPFLAGTLSRNHAGNQRFQIGCSLDEGRSQCEIGRDAADGFAGGERAVFAV